MQVEIIANRLSEKDTDTEQLYNLSKGDVVTVSDSFGQHLCDRGWAKDVEGAYANAPFTPGAATLEPKTTRIVKEPSHG